MPRLFLLSLACIVATFSTTRADDLRLLPADTEMVATINVKQLLESELAKGNKDFIEQIRGTIESRLPADNEGLKLLKKLGFDPMKDLERITFANNGTKDPRNGILIVEGKFSADKVDEVAAEAARDYPDLFKINKAGKHAIYEIIPPQGGQAYVTFTGGNMMLISMEVNSVNHTLGRLAGTRKIEAKKEVKDLLQNTNDKQSMSVVLTNKALANLSEENRLPNAEQINQAVQQVEGVSLSITATKDIQFQLGIGSKDEATAKKMVAGLNGGLIFVRAMLNQKAQEDPNFTPAVEVANTIRVTATGTNTLIRGEVGFATLEKVIKTFNRLAP